MIEKKKEMHSPQVKEMKGFALSALYASFLCLCMNQAKATAKCVLINSNVKERKRNMKMFSRLMSHFTVTGNIYTGYPIQWSQIKDFNSPACYVRIADVAPWCFTDVFKSLRTKC